MISDFAQKLGMEVLYEGIENSNQLNNCLASKGRYYQGYLLSKPLSCIKHAEFNYEAFKLANFKSISENQKSCTKNRTLKNTFDYMINEYQSKNEFINAENEIDEYYSGLCLELPECAKRIYICNRYGYQISSNIEKTGEIISLFNYKNKNWAWRGYFQDAMKAICSGQNSFLTEAYRDATSKEKIYTYITAADENTFIFIDIVRDDI